MLKNVNLLKRTQSERSFSLTLGQTFLMFSFKFKPLSIDFNFHATFPISRLNMKHQDPNWSVVLSVVYYYMNNHSTTELFISQSSVGWLISNGQSFYWSFLGSPGAPGTKMVPSLVHVWCGFGWASLATLLHYWETQPGLLYMCQSRSVSECWISTGQSVSDGRTWNQGVGGDDLREGMAEGILP